MIVATNGDAVTNLMLQGFGTINKFPLKGKINQDTWYT